MSRDFRFRAWDIEKKRWLPIDEIVMDWGGTPWIDSMYTHNTEFGLTSSNDRLVWQQFTGLYDKNGTPVFEGDIVATDEQVASDTGEEGTKGYIELRKEENFKYANGTFGTRYFGRATNVVEWIDSSCGFEPFSDSRDNCGHCGGGMDPNTLEVIGNIYSDPHLLKETK